MPHKTILAISISVLGLFAFFERTSQETEVQFSDTEKVTGVAEERNESTVSLEAHTSYEKSEQEKLETSAEVGLDPVRVIKKDPLYKFARLTAKVFLTPEEEIELRKNREDTELLDRAQNYLSRVSPEGFTHAGEKHRIHATVYFEDRLKNTEGAVFHQTVDRVFEILESKNVQKAQDRRLKRSLIGDKVLLFSYVLEHAPERAEEYYQRQQNSSHTKILKYAYLRFSKTNQNN